MDLYGKYFVTCTSPQFCTTFVFSFLPGITQFAQFGFGRWEGGGGGSGREGANELHYGRFASGEKKDKNPKIY